MDTMEVWPREMSWCEVEPLSAHSIMWPFGTDPSPTHMHVPVSILNVLVCAILNEFWASRA